MVGLGREGGAGIDQRSHTGGGGPVLLGNRVGVRGINGSHAHSDALSGHSSAHQACLAQLVRDLMLSLAILSGSEDEALKASETVLVERILLPTLRVAYK